MAKEQQTKIEGGAGEAPAAPLGGGPAAPSKRAAAEGPTWRDVQWWRVMAPHQTMYNGGVQTLPQGELIQEGPYDIAALQNAGCQLQKSDPPAWWKKLQEADDEAKARAAKAAKAAAAAG